MSATRLGRAEVEGGPTRARNQAWMHQDTRNSSELELSGRPASEGTWQAVVQSSSRGSSSARAQRALVHMSTMQAWAVHNASVKINSPSFLHPSCCLPHHVWHNLLKPT
jgi:hypothetical protein